MKWTSQYKKAVTFSYDDGVIYDRRLVDLFNRYGLKCTFNINTGIKKGENIFRIQDTVVDRMDLEEMKVLYAAHEIAAHSLTHPDLTKMSDREVIWQMEEDIKNIELLTGKPVRGMAYPYGGFDDRIVSILSNLGLKYARTVISTHKTEIQEDLMRFKPTCHHNDPELFRIIEEFLESSPSQPQILYIWGHSYEFDKDKNWDRIESICKILSGNPFVYFGTNAQVLLDATDY